MKRVVWIVALLQCIIKVQSQCSYGIYSYDDTFVFGFDTCASSYDSSNGAYSSHYYTCNSDHSQVLMYTYENANCSGDTWNTNRVTKYFDSWICADESYDQGCISVIRIFMHNNSISSCDFANNPNASYFEIPYVSNYCVLETDDGGATISVQFVCTTSEIAFIQYNNDGCFGSGTESGSDIYEFGHCDCEFNNNTSLYECVYVEVVAGNDKTCLAAFRDVSNTTTTTKTHTDNSNNSNNDNYNNSNSNSSINNGTLVLDSTSCRDNSHIAQLVRKLSDATYTVGISFIVVGVTFMIASVVYTRVIWARKKYGDYMPNADKKYKQWDKTDWKHILVVSFLPKVLLDARLGRQQQQEQEEENSNPRATKRQKSTIGSASDTNELADRLIDKNDYHINNIDRRTTDSGVRSNINNNDVEKHLSSWKRYKSSDFMNVRVFWVLYGLYTDVTYSLYLYALYCDTETYVWQNPYFMTYLASLIIEWGINVLLIIHVLKYEFNENELFGKWFDRAYSFWVIFFLSICALDMNMFISLFQSNAFYLPLFQCPFTIHSAKTVYIFGSTCVLCQHVVQLIVQILIDVNGLTDRDARNDEIRDMELAVTIAGMFVSFVKICTWTTYARPFKKNEPKHTLWRIYSV